MKFLAIFLWSLLFVTYPCWANDDDADMGDLLSLSLEELVLMDVTSVSKKEEHLFSAAAAIYVITQDDIQRSGVTSIPEALRLAPGMHVAQIDATKWAVSSRGFNTRFANYMLVLIDGRTVFSPLFSGVFWEQQDLPLELIDRIEVIRGPGGTLWGANALNGVINIITKKPSGKKRGMFTGNIGNTQQSGSVVLEGPIEEINTFQVYGYGNRREASALPNGGSAHDSWHSRILGMRFERQISKTNWTLQGGFLDGRRGERAQLGTLTTPFLETIDHEDPVRVGFVMGKMTHHNLEAKVFFDWNKRREIGLNLEVLTFDSEIQYRLKRGVHDVVFGGGYRVLRDDSDSSFVGALLPHSQRDGLLNVFVQDEINLFDNRLALIVGTKFEHHTQTGGEVQPNLRLRWSNHSSTTLWGAISRGVQIPSRSHRDIRLVTDVIPPGGLGPQSPVAFVTYFGDDTLKPVEVMAYEMGFRTMIYKRVSFDLATFYNRYKNLLTNEPKGAPNLVLSPLPYFVVPVGAFDHLEGTTLGGEAVIEFHPTDMWRLQTIYSYLNIDLGDNINPQAQLQTELISSAKHQLALRVMFQPASQINFNLWGRYVSEIDGQQLDAYTNLDVQIAWRPHNHLSIGFVGQNLLHKEQVQFTDSSLGAEVTAVKRRYYGKVAWEF